MAAQLIHDRICGWCYRKDKQNLEAVCCHNSSNEFLEVSGSVNGSSRPVSDIASYCAIICRAIGTCSLHTLLHAICHSSREEVAFHDLSYAFSYFSPFNDLSLHDHVDKNNKDSSAEKICTTSRFVFGVESINSLRAEAKDGDYDESSKPFTSYEALVAFIWKHMTPACKMESNSTRPTIVIHILDMRRRVSEPFSRYTIDNILWPVMVFCEKQSA
ncbi:hypothetical protein JHK85_010461 [Glycine max]|nr:hypothetical protein JHK85_010461 [Glycine max]